VTSGKILLLPGCAALCWAGLASALALAQDIAPVERVPPDYPAAALAFSIEAACLVTFDIRNDGSTANVGACCGVGSSQYPDRVVPPAIGGLFVHPSVAAVLRWRYTTAPGEPSAVQREGFQTVLDYRLREESGEPITPESFSIPLPETCAEEPIA
jgi:hypothetical protein